MLSVRTSEWLKSGDNAFNMGRMMAVTEYNDCDNGSGYATGLYESVKNLLSGVYAGAEDEPDYWQLFIDGMDEGRNEIKRGRL
jgi:hypothetical protein